VLERQPVPGATLAERLMLYGMLGRTAAEALLPPVLLPFSEAARLARSALLSEGRPLCMSAARPLPLACL